MDLTSLSIGSNIGIYLVSAVIVWIFGTKLAGYVDVIANKTGIGHGFMGVFILGGVTSLPEIATVGSAAYLGNIPLATSTILGSIAINIVILALMDAVIGKDALTSGIADPSNLFHGSLSILLLTLTAAACVVGSADVGGVSPWSYGLLISFVFMMWLSSRYPKQKPWATESGGGRKQKSNDKESDDKDKNKNKKSISRLWMWTTLAAVMILVAGFFLAQSGGAIAKQSGLGASLVGIVLVALATGLPEISSTYASMKLGRYEMALGDIFGTNMWNVVVLVLADFLYLDGSIFGTVGAFEQVAVLLTIVLTCLMLLGLIERKDKTWFRMGYDSLAVIATYLAGLVLLYFIDKGGS